MTIKEKILNGIMLTEQEVRSIYYEEEGINIFDKIYVEKRRWHDIVMLILVIEERYFSILVHKGATERQENEYPEQVTQEVVQKEVTRTEWVRKQQGKDND